LRQTHASTLHKYRNRRRSYTDTNLTPSVKHTNRESAHYDKSTSCRHQIGGLRPIISTSQDLHPSALPGSSCAVIPTIGATMNVATETEQSALQSRCHTTRPNGAGGCDFFADPDKSADQVPVFWLPEAHSASVVLSRSPVENEAVIQFQPDTWRGELVSRSASDGVHLILVDGRDEHRVWLPNPPSEGTPLAAIIPLDRAVNVRAAAAIRFYRQVTGRGRRRVGRQLPQQRQTRLILGLRALDGRLKGATYREIAVVLFGADRVPERGWKVHDLRDRTIRLVRFGVVMMRGGYRRLLLDPYRR